MQPFSAYHFREDAKIVTKRVPGPKSERLIKLQKEIEGNIVSYPASMPIAIDKAKGAIIKDVDGNYFIDFFAGCGVLNVGHCNQDVLKEVRKQQNNLIHALDFPTRNKLNLITKIIDQLPDQLRNEYKVSFCASTGSDAIEAAIKLARHKTGRDAIIAFQGSYHGMTSGALSVTSFKGYRETIKLSIPNIHFIPYSYCYRCPFGKKSESCNLECAQYLKNVLENPLSGIPKPAAIIMEPIQGEGGTIVPSKGYLESIVKIARDNGILVIFDEVQCGFFRTGEFLEFKNTDAIPDIIVMSKGLGGIGFPISAILYRKEIESWGTGQHIGTFRGNQVSIAAGNAALDFIMKNGVKEHVAEAGAYLMDKLRTLQQESPYIGDVRGRGLFVGIEYVKDKETKEPFPEMVQKLRMSCFERGLLFEVGGHYKNVIRFVPPLIITKNIIDNAMNIFSSAVREIENEYCQKVNE